MASNPKRIFAHQVRLNAGGYDDTGRYFGGGETLYYIARGDETGYVRAPSREHAVTWVSIYGVGSLDRHGIDGCRKMFGLVTR